jgi:hypothetical protein
LESPGKLFDHRRLSGSADRQVANADNEAPELPFFENSCAIQIKAELDNPEIKEREKQKRHTQEGGQEVVPLVEDYFDSVVFELI